MTPAGGEHLSSRSKVEGGVLIFRVFSSEVGRKKRGGFM